MKLLAQTYQLSPRRTLHPGCKVRVTGERGTYLYRCASISPAGNVSIHLYGAEGFRAFRPDRIRAIVRKGGNHEADN